MGKNRGPRGTVDGGKPDGKGGNARQTGGGRRPIRGFPSRESPKSGETHRSLNIFYVIIYD